MASQQPIKICKTFEHFKLATINENNYIELLYWNFDTIVHELFFRSLEEFSA